MVGEPVSDYDLVLKKNFFALVVPQNLAFLFVFNLTYDSRFICIHMHHASIDLKLVVNKYQGLAWGLWYCSSCEGNPNFTSFGPWFTKSTTWRSSVPQNPNSWLCYYGILWLTFGALIWSLNPNWGPMC